MAKTYQDKLWEQITDKTDRDMGELIGILKGQGMLILDIQTYIKQALETDTLENILAAHINI